jgi:omega-6 fatty acid desaturase (delta-12 desaturase)
LFTRHPLTILFGYVTVFLFGMVINPFVTSPRKHFDCLLSLLAHIGLALFFLSFGWPTLVLALVLPRFIATAMGSYLFYAQHNFPGVSFKDNPPATSKRVRSWRGLPATLAIITSTT